MYCKPSKPCLRHAFSRRVWFLGSRHHPYLSDVFFFIPDAVPDTLVLRHILSNEAEKFTRLSLDKVFEA